MLSRWWQSSLFLFLIYHEWIGSLTNHSSLIWPPLLLSTPRFYRSSCWQQSASFLLRPPLLLMRPLSARMRLLPTRTLMIAEEEELSPLETPLSKKLPLPMIEICTSLRWTKKIFENRSVFLPVTKITSRSEINSWDCCDQIRARNDWWGNKKTTNNYSTIFHTTHNSYKPKKENNSRPTWKRKENTGHQMPNVPFTLYEHTHSKELWIISTTNKSNEPMLQMEGNVVQIFIQLLCQSMLPIWNLSPTMCIL